MSLYTLFARSSTTSASGAIGSSRISSNTSSSSSISIGSSSHQMQPHSLRHSDAYRMVQTVGSRNSQPWTPLASSLMATAVTPVLLRLLLLLLWGLCKAAAAASAAAAGHVNLLNIEVCCCARRMAGNAQGPVVCAWPPHRSRTSSSPLSPIRPCNTARFRSRNPSFPLRPIGVCKTTRCSID